MLRGRLPLALLVAVGCASAPRPAPPAATVPAAPPRAPGTAEITVGGAPTPSATTTAPPAAEAALEVHDGGIRAAPDKPAANESWGGMGFKEVTEKDWLAGVKQGIATQWKVDPTALILSPGRLHAAFVRGPAEPANPPKKPPRHPPPRRFQIIVVDNQAKKVAAIRPMTAKGSDEPPKDVKFLTEDKIIYEVVSAPPPVLAAEGAAPAKSESAAPAKTKANARGKSAKASKGKPTAPAAMAKTGSGKKGARAAAPTVAAATVPEKPAGPPPRVFVIQSLEPRTKPVRCEGHHFAFTAQVDRIAYVGGTPEAGFVAVDGAAVYPRRGRTVIPSAVTWSKDGRSLAFLEAPAGGTPKLVLLAEYDNPTGDTTWDLPATTPVDGTRVFWAGSGKLVVGKTITHPIFSASFQKQLPR